MLNNWVPKIFDNALSQSPSHSHTHQIYGPLLKEYIQSNLTKWHIHNEHKEEPMDCYVSQLTRATVFLPINVAKEIIELVNTIRGTHFWLRSRPDPV